MDRAAGLRHARSLATTPGVQTPRKCNENRPLFGRLVGSIAAVMTVGRPYTWRLIVPVVAVVAVDIALVIAMWLPFSGSIQASDRPLVEVQQQLQDGYFSLD